MAGTAGVIFDSRPVEHEDDDEAKNEYVVARSRVVESKATLLIAQDSESVWW
jgi:hypothetical protein